MLNKSEFFYERIASTLILDSLYLYFLTPFGIITLISNITCFIIIQRHKLNAKKTCFYKYIKVYQINNIVMSLLITCTFFSFSPRHLPDYISFGYLAKVLRCKINPYVLNSLTYFTDLLDIIIVLDRISIFLKKIKQVNSCYKSCLIGFLIALFISLPSIFWYNTRTDQEFNNCSIQFECLKTFTYCSINENMFNHYLGQILNFIVILIKDIITLIIEFSLSLILLIQFRKFLTKKARHLGVGIKLNNLNDKNILKKSTKRNNFLLDNRLSLITIYLSISSFILHLCTFTTGVLIIVFKGNIIYSNKFYFLSICLTLSKSLLNSILFVKSF